MQLFRMTRGFTLIELLAVMAIIATLLTFAAPRYFGSLDKSKEAVLKENLSTMRDVLDKHYADTGQYPTTLEQLVERQYLRRIPLDPITESNRTWVALPPPEGRGGGIYDIRSGAKGRARDGSAYSDW